jgi:hypothetical protein
LRLAEKESGNEAGLDCSDEPKLGAERLLSRLVTKQPAREKGSGRSSDQGQTEEVCFRDTPIARPGSALILPKAQYRPGIDQDESEGGNGNHAAS